MINFYFAVLIFVIIADLFQIYSPFFEKTPGFFGFFLNFLNFRRAGAPVFPSLFFIRCLVYIIIVISYFFIDNFSHL